jgi:hypothetical protein
MARPRKDTSSDLFSSTEMAIGASLTVRAFALLQEAGLAPDPVENSRGRSGHALFDSEGLEHAGVIRAFYGAGAQTFLAARLARAFYVEWKQCGYTGLDKLSRLNGYYRQAASKITPDDFKILPDDLKNTFTLHRALRLKTNIYKPYTALREDMVVEIVDRKYVFEPTLAGFKIPIHSPVSGIVPATPAYRISGWGRGTDAVISDISREVPTYDFQQDEESAAIYRQIETEFLNARQNAVGTIRVNVSLAVRNAFDAVNDHRLTVSRPHNQPITIDADN